MGSLRSESTLLDLLARIDGRSYPAYRELRGGWSLGDVELHLDHVQGDPFAAPSRIRIRLPQEVAGWPEELFQGRVRRVALSDWLARQLARAIHTRGAQRQGSGKSGLVAIDAGGQEVLERNAVLVTRPFVEARLQVGLPAAGRRVLGRQAERLLREELPALARAGLRREALDLAEAHRALQSAEDHAFLQAQLAEHDLVAFLADGAILPRESGASSRPLRREAIPLRAPEALRVTLPLPPRIARPEGQLREPLCGLGIRAGVTLIVGGGYHGKSTLLRALERGVYPHLPGDGREQVVTEPSAVKIRAEDGRRVVGCDISGFIADLPRDRCTERFHSDDASGSTSQAANIAEALEAGARLLLLDEDTSATNFMVRDARMQALVAKEHEPITPFVDRVRELYDRFGVSTVLVMGGSGDYFDVADTVIEMHAYQPRDVSERARRIARDHPTGRRHEARRPLGPIQRRVPLASSLDPSRGRQPVRIAVRELDQLDFGRQRIDLRAVEQLVDRSQTRAIGYALALARERFMAPEVTLAEVLDALEELLDVQGLDALCGRPEDLARPRRQEVAAALSRLRSLRAREAPGDAAQAKRCSRARGSAASDP